MKLPIIIFITVLFFSFDVNAQKAKAPANPKDVEFQFSNGNYAEALEGYLSLLKDDPRNEKYNYNIAVCYLNTNIDKSKAIPYLELVSRMPKSDPNGMYLLARAYLYANRFDDAIKAFTKFKETGRGSSDNLKDADHQLQYCYNAKELIKYPIDVTFENLGKLVNSPYPDYYPFIPADESFLVFSSKRTEGSVRAIDGAYTANIFISKVASTGFQKAKTLGPPVNTADGDEEVIGLSNDGKTMLVYFDNMNAFGDIFLVEGDKALNYRKPIPLSASVNDANATELSAALSADGNTLYFTSDRSGGQGGSDIYISRKLPNGEWGPATNLGPEVNTAYDEDFPNISHDGKTLYFSSKGHTSMGGYDIFRIDWDEAGKKWTGLKNIGYPINTSDDDMNLRLSQTGRYGYIAALREGGLGDLDIYRVTFKDVEPVYTVIKGAISSIDTTQKVGFPDVFMTVTNTETQELVGNYVPNPTTGRYIIIVPPGNYSLDIEAPGFQLTSEKIDIAEKVSYKTEIEKNYKLTPEGYTPPQPAKATPKKK